VKLQQANTGISNAAFAYYLVFIPYVIFEGLHRKIDAFDPLVATALARGKPVPDS
jgi:hypothetical protein